MKRCKLFFVAFLLLLFIPVLSHARDTQTFPLTTFTEVADYIKKYNSLPNNFITKQEAKNHGWNPARHNLWDVAPGKSIGGDRFFNREKKLPDKRGRIWYEADINYKGGKRGKDRIIFSNDGLIYKTEDHYKTFTRME
jgi:hypothetical protein